MIVMQVIMWLQKIAISNLLKFQRIGLVLVPTELNTSRRKKLMDDLVPHL